MRADGHLTRLDTAFSRDQEDKVYVQDRMLEQAPLFWSWLRTAPAYTCAATPRAWRRMYTPRCIASWRKQGGMSAQAAEEYVHALKEEHRYHRDVY